MLSTSDPQFLVMATILGHQEKICHFTRIFRRDTGKIHSFIHRMKNYGHFPLGLTMVRASWSDMPVIEIQDGVTPRFFSRNKELFCPRPTAPGQHLHLMLTSQHPNTSGTECKPRSPQLHTRPLPLPSFWVAASGLPRR